MASRIEGGSTTTKLRLVFSCTMMDFIWVWGWVIGRLGFQFKKLSAAAGPGGASLTSVGYEGATLFHYLLFLLRNAVFRKRFMAVTGPSSQYSRHRSIWVWRTSPLSLNPIMNFRILRPRHRVASSVTLHLRLVINNSSADCLWETKVYRFIPFRLIHHSLVS